MVAVQEILAVVSKLEKLISFSGYAIKSLGLGGYSGSVGKLFTHISFVSDSCLLVCVDSLCTSQQFFSHVGMISNLPGLNQY